MNANKLLDQLWEFVCIPWVSRLLSLGVAAGTSGVLLTAMWLTPAKEGHATHLQLGLNQCTFLTLTGQPCPMCGATTTFTHLAHGHLLQGIINQPFAAVLFAMTIFAWGVAVSEVIAPRQRWSRLSDWIEPYENRLAGAFLVLMCTSWLYKAWLMGTLLR